MKLFKLLLISTLCLFAFNSCKDSNDRVDGSDDSKHGYLVMHYAVGSKNLDQHIMSNILHALDEGTNDNVKMTFEYKMSYDYQYLSEYDEIGNQDLIDYYKQFENFQGTRRFTGDDNNHLQGKYYEVASDYLNNNKDFLLSKKEIINFCKSIKSEKLGDQYINMSSVDGLADFIKWSKEQYPDMHTILVISDHGEGWQFESDGMYDSGLGKTRGILIDDNRDFDILTLNETVEGIKNGGGVDLLYTDACLMNMYENMYGYATCAKYLISSTEVTPGRGGNFSEFIKLLKNAGDSMSDFVTALHRFVDSCVSNEWWGNLDNNYNDIGFYDLTQIDQLTSVLKRVTDTLVEKYINDENVKPTIDTWIPEGVNYRSYINTAVISCEVASRHDSLSISDFGFNIIPSGIYQAIEEDSDFITVNDNKFDLEEMIAWLDYGQIYCMGAQKLYQKDPDAYNRFMNHLCQRLKTSFVISDLIRVLDKKLKSYDALNNPFTQLKQDLIDTFKSIAYIRCSKENEWEDIDPAYELCTPGVKIVSFVNEYYNGPINENVNKIFPNSADALSVYQNLEFDKKVGWSRFLKILNALPSASSNPSRARIKYSYKQ